MDGSDGWPTPEPGQAHVLILGTYHMDNPGLDAFNINADDVLTDDRQAELRDLVDRLEGWSPDHIAVERPHDREATVNEAYRGYRDGDHDYAEEAELTAAGHRRDDPTAESRSEVVQVGFRLADRLGHEAVHAVDSHPEPPEEVDGLPAAPPTPEDVPYPVPDFAEFEADNAARLRESTVVEYHRYLNREENLHDNHGGMFAAAVPAGADEDYAGAAILGNWYERNLRIAQNVWSAVGPGDRVLLLVGSGHVHVLRHLFGEAPMACPVSALPVLE